MSNKVDVKKMKPAAKRALVPKLRFPEFRDAGEWVEKQLGEVSDVRDGTHDSPKFVSVGKPLVTSKNLLSDGSLDIENVSFISEQDCEQINKRSRVDIGDILFGMIGTIGNPVLVQSDGYAIKNVALIKQQHELLNKYLVHLLNSEYIATKFNQLNTGNTQKFIALGKIRSLEIPVPTEPEQQKIADCLSSLDELITAEAKKLDTFKAHKKGLMQQFFPAEGETLPKLRFPEFRDAGEWKKHRVSSFLKKVSNPVNVNLDEMYRQIGIRSHGKGIFHKELVSGKELGHKRVFWVEEDAFVVNIVFAWEQAVANTTTTEKGMIASHRFPMYKAKTHKSDVNYIKYFFLTRKGKHLLWLASPGGAGRNKTLGQKEFENLEFILPGKAEEQTKIAECLSSFDELIVEQTKKLDTLKTHKKGLMQQLFPSADEVNG